MTDHDPDLQTSRGYASSPCSAHEFEQPSLSREETISLLNELIAGERAGAVGIIEMARNTPEPEHNALLQTVAKDEARFCAMLSHHVTRLGGEPNRDTGVFAEKLAKRETLDDKLALLDKGQSVVVKMLAEAIPRIEDPQLRHDLTTMHDVHVVNITRCNALIAEP